jgi:hypothetical protein
MVTNTACWDLASKLKVICLDAKKMDMHKTTIDDICVHVLYYMLFISWLFEFAFITLPVASIQ